MSAPGPDANARLREQLRVLREGKWIILICVVLTSALAVGFAASQDKEYLSTARVLIQPDNLGGSVVGIESSGAVDPVRQSATDLELVEQPALAARVLERLELEGSPTRLLERVEGKAQGNSNVIAIEATAKDPDDAADLANAYAAEYVTFRAANDRRRVRRVLRGVERRLERAEADGASSEEIARLRDEAEDLSLLESLQTGNAEVVQLATPPTNPVSPRPVRNGVLGLVIGLLLGVGLAFLRDRLDPRLKSEDEVGDLLPGVPAIAAIPRRAPGPIGRAAESEGFRSLQTTLAYLEQEADVRSVLVTSATVGEGKSTTSLNLALAMAERDQSVILLEGDLRRRGLSERLGLRNVSGLSNVLSGKEELDDVLVQVSLDGAVSVNGHRRRNGHGASANGSSAVLSGIVSVVPAGPPPRNPHALLSSRAAEGVVSKAGELADRVVIDGTPVGLVNDMLPLARDVDAVVLVVQLYHTRRNELRRLRQLLEQAGINPFGIVLFGTEPNRSYHSYLRA